MEKHTDLHTSQTDSQLYIGVQPESTDSAHQKAHLSPKETRQIVTPYAFFVADDLLGTPLAGPFRRGFGLLIDMFFITLLTQVSSLVLAGVAAWTFFRAGNRLKTIKRYNAARIFLRLLVALLLFVLVMGIFDEINEDTNKDILDGRASDTVSTNVSFDGDNSVYGIELLALTAKYLLKTNEMKQQVSQKKCEPAYECFQMLGEELVKDMLDFSLDRDTIDDALEGYLGSVSKNLSDQQNLKLTHRLQKFVKTKFAAINSLEPESTEPESTEPESTEPESTEQKSTEPEVTQQLTIEQQVTQPVDTHSEKGKQNAQPKGLVRWFDNLVEEFGLGFGWAAFYFSIFTAWWKGQTPGKKLMGMKVIKLDNTPLNLWESFGRYGGYAAGFATGLMGFLQVFWDPNRQAIHDKISETLVIDLRKPKVLFVKEMVE